MTHQISDVHFLIQASRHDEAEHLFKQAQLLAPSDPSVYMMAGNQINPSFFSSNNPLLRNSNFQKTWKKEMILTQSIWIATDVIGRMPAKAYVYDIQQVER